MFKFDSVCVISTTYQGWTTRLGRAPFLISRMNRATFERSQIEGVINDDSAVDLCGDLEMSAGDWREVKDVGIFLAPAADCTFLMSGSRYSTILYRPMFYKRLTAHCNSHTNGANIMYSASARKAAWAFKDRL